MGWYLSTKLGTSIFRI
ncbi:hypothetical protein [Convivina intestini]